MKIAISDMDFGYGNLQVLHGVDLVLDEPGLVCIVGPNGVGKSTLVKCMNKLLTPSAGSIEIDDHDLKDISIKDLSKVMGYVPVTSNDSFSMTVLDTVLMGRHPHQKMGTTSDYDMTIVKRTLAMMGIKHLALRDFDELSAGQHQKVAIARGLAQTPRILILDEPTSNLDVRHQMQVTELLHDLAVKNSMIVVMISHDLNITAKYADKVVMMSLPGIVYKVGTPGEVMTADAIRHVYGVDCRIIDDEGRPHIILTRALKEGDERDGPETPAAPSTQRKGRDRETLPPNLILAMPSPLRWNPSGRRSTGRRPSTGSWGSPGPWRGSGPSRRRTACRTSS